MSNSNLEANKNRRLMISRMELENFKSYAGVQSIGPFHKSFSSIVGPNGSGKSNVIDALLFVFGKRAKQLRLNKVSELIHKSSNYPSLDFARVTVYFQLILDNESSDDDFEIIPGSEFSITRIAYLNNQSKYMVDNKSSTFTEVGQLLRNYGVDLDNNRFLILQGEVEQIAMMKPKGQTPHEDGLLEYLEDIIGSNTFVEKIEEKSKELEEINEKRSDKIHKLKLAEKERDNLSEAKGEVELYIEKDKIIRNLKNKLYQYYLHNEAKKINEVTEQYNLKKSELEEERNKMKEFEAELIVIEKKYEQIQKEHERVDKDLQKFTTQYDAFERRDVKLQEDMKHAKANIKKFQAALQKESKKEKELLEEAEKIAAQVEKYRATLKDFEQNKIEAEEELAKIMNENQEETAPLRLKLEEIQKEIAKEEKVVADINLEKEIIITSQDLLKKRSLDIKNQVDALKSKLTKLEADEAGLKEIIANDENYEQKEYLPLKNELEKKNKELEAEQVALSAQITNAMIELEEKKSKFQNQQSRGSGNKLTQQLMNATKPGGALANCGLLGRLGDLGSISSEYDVAATSSGGGSLDFLVVKTPQDAQECVNFLRVNNLGRASFIILSQLRQPPQKSKDIKDAPRLFDLITDIEEGVEPAFYLVFKETLVVKDLDYAVKIAYESDNGKGSGPARHRVVTLDGQIIDVSGAMTGGGNEVRRGGIRLSKDGESSSRNKKKQADKNENKITEEMIKNDEESLRKLEDKLNRIRDEKNGVEDRLREITIKYNKIKGAKEKNQHNLLKIAEQIKDINKKIHEIEKKSELTPEEKIEFEENNKKLIAIEAKINEVSPNLRTYQQESSSLQRQILSLGGSKLTKAQAKIDSLTNQIETFTSTLATKEVDEATARKNMEKAMNARVKAENDIKKLEEKIQTLLDEQKEMENDALKVVEIVEQAKANLAELVEKLQQSSKEYNDMKESISSKKIGEVDLNAEVERLTGEVKAHTNAQRHYQKDIDNLRKQHEEEQREFLLTIKSVTYSINNPTEANDENKMDVANPDLEVDDSELEFLPDLSPEEIEELNCEELKRDINLYEAEKNKLKGNVNMNALLDYLRKDANYKVRLAELEAINAERAKVRDEYEDLRRQRLDMFMAGFGTISLRLKEMYQMITLGGDAELELLDSLDPFSEGISFSVRPPKKSWKQIGNLSGGEKTLSSLALVFALHYYKPTPLYVMDEIDAALDFKNVSIVANYIKERTKNAQFIIISLRNNMFELADRLVGIYKTHDTTKSVTINPKLFNHHPSSAEGTVAR